MEFAVIATGTGIGKTRVTGWLTAALRAQGRQVWVHKPIACGGWQDGQAEDGRALGALCGDGQLARDICPIQLRAAIAPHQAAALEEVTVDLEQLLANLQRVRAGASARGSDLLVEGVGGLLAPLSTQRATVCDYLVAARMPVLIVTAPEVGTINHTALTVAHARRCGLALVGLVVNENASGNGRPLTPDVARELLLCTGVEVIAQLPWVGEGQGMPHQALELARWLLAWAGGAAHEAGNEPRAAPGV